MGLYVCPSQICLPAAFVKHFNASTGNLQVISCLLHVSLVWQPGLKMMVGRCSAWAKGVERNWFGLGESLTDVLVYLSLDVAVLYFSWLLRCERSSFAFQFFICTRKSWNPGLFDAARLSTSSKGSGVKIWNKNPTNCVISCDFSVFRYMDCQGNVKTVLSPYCRKQQELLALFQI